MRRWIRLASALYPREWRDRYGEEFHALLEDGGAGWREFIDVMLGALKMQMSTATTYLKIAGATAVAGAIVAGAASYSVPRQYVSEAVVRMAPSPGTQAAQPEPLRVADNSPAYQFGRVTSEVLSRSSLIDAILDPSLDLYKEERRQVPLEDVILQMRRDIQISPIPMPPPSGAGAPMTARITFAYRDKDKAREVVRWLVARTVAINGKVNGNRATIWRYAWPSDPVPSGEEIVILDPASVPRPIRPNRLAFMAGGLAVGLLLGLLAASVMRQPKWTLQMAGCAVAGCILAVAVSFLIPDRYTSTAVMRFTPPVAPPRVSGDMAGMPTAEKLQQLEQEVLSRASLSQVIQKPSLNLYPEQRAHTPLEDIVERMRSRDLRIQRVRSPVGSTTTFSISFSYPDQRKAAAVVREVVSQFANQHMLAMHSRAMDLKPGDEVRTAIEHKFGENLELLEAPGFPERPSGPGRLTFAAGGLAFGLLAGALIMRSRRRSRDLQPA